MRDVEQRRRLDLFRRSTRGAACIVAECSTGPGAASEPGVAGRGTPASSAERVDGQVADPLPVAASPPGRAIRPSRHELVGGQGPPAAVEVEAARGRGGRRRSSGASASALVAGVERGFERPAAASKARPPEQPPGERGVAACDGRVGRRSARAARLGSPSAEPGSRRAPARRRSATAPRASPSAGATAVCSERRPRSSQRRLTRGVGGRVAARRATSASTAPRGEAAIGELERTPGRIEGVDVSAVGSCARRQPVERRGRLGGPARAPTSASAAPGAAPPRRPALARGPRRRRSSASAGRPSRRRRTPMLVCGRARSGRSSPPRR